MKESIQYDAIEIGAPRGQIPIKSVYITVTCTYLSLHFILVFLHEVSTYGVLELLALFVSLTVCIKHLSMRSAKRS